MQYSVGVEYAFHSLFYMVSIPGKGVLGIRALARLHGISETYLSKIFTKLSKNGIVRSTPGVKGGYVLSCPANQITFWDIIEAVEGSSYLFQCAELRQSNTFSDPASFSPDCPCPINVVMVDAEEKMREHLKSKTLEWLYKQTYSTFSKEKKKAIKEWLAENVRSLS